MGQWAVSVQLGSLLAADQVVGICLDGRTHPRGEAVEPALPSTGGQTRLLVEEGAQVVTFEELVDQSR
jgi:hypothetical protein